MYIQNKMYIHIYIYMYTYSYITYTCISVYSHAYQHAPAFFVNLTGPAAYGISDILRNKTKQKKVMMTNKASFEVNALNKPVL